MPDENPDKPVKNAPEEETVLTDDQLDDVSGGTPRRHPAPPPLPGKSVTH